MFCYNCGIKLDDKARFCPNCGTKVIVDENKPEPVAEPVPMAVEEAVTEPAAEVAAEPVTEVTPEPVAEPAVAPVAVPVVTPAVAPIEEPKPIVVPTIIPETVEKVPTVEEKTKACVKKSVSSVLFLIATILFTLSVIFSTVSFFMTVESDPYGYYEEPGIFDKVSVSEYEDETLTLDDVKYVFGMFEFMDESLVLIIGLFLAFIFAKSKKDMKTGGLTVVKVATGIKIGFSFIFALLMICAGVAVCASVPEELIGAMVVVLIPMFIAAGVIYVIFCFKLSAGIGKIRNIATTGVPTAKLSGLIVVVLFAVGAANLLSVNGYITVNDVAYTLNWADSLYALTKGASCILFGLTVAMLKKKLKSLSEEYKLVNTPAPAGQIIINKNVNI